MLVFDTNNFFYQIKLSRKINQLEKQKEYFAQQIEEVEATKDELFSTEAKKEKICTRKIFYEKR
ncbi:MAG: hypothetical protein LRY27_03480 [Chitinophagales bacterium]|nr:hypothetical protein [Chitinophagales bacterium]